VIFGRPFVKRFPYAIGPLSCLSVCLSVTFIHCGQTVGRIKIKLGTQVGLVHGHIVLDGDPAHPPPKRHSPTIFGPYLLRPNGCMDQDATWYRDRPRPSGLCVRWEPTSPPRKGGTAPSAILGPFLCYMAGCIKMPLGMEVGLSSGDFVIDGDPAAPPQKGGRAPKFSAYVYCGQTAGWIKMVLGMAVGLSPGDFVLDGDPAPSPKRRQSPSPIFGPFLLWPNGWI